MDYMKKFNVNLENNKLKDSKDDKSDSNDLDILFEKLRNLEEPNQPKNQSKSLEGKKTMPYLEKDAIAPLEKPLSKF